MGRLRRWLYRGAWLLKSLFLNLTPTRRVLLALALLLCNRVQAHDDRNSLQIDFGGISIVLLVLLLMLELKDKLVAKSELQAGRIVQQAMLPKEAPHITGWDIWISTRPANEVGGDLVDFVTHDEEQSIHLAPGQTLVVYSDGVTDALNEDKAFFGDQRLLGSLHETAGRPAAEVARELLGAVEAFVGEALWHDDVSLIVLRRAE